LDRGGREVFQVPGEPLLLYIVTTTDVVSMVLVAEQPEPCNTKSRKLRRRLRNKRPSQPHNFMIRPVPSWSPSTLKPI
jgi:hypothetical protein